MNTMPTRLIMTGVLAIPQIIGYANAHAQCDPVESQKILASDGEESDGFGGQVALLGNRAAIGANRHYNDDGVRTGAVYLFENIDGVWTETAELFPSNGAGGDYFSGPSMYEETVVAGASWAREGYGCAYVFEQVDGVWTEIAQLYTEAPTWDAGFGAVTAIWGDTVMVPASGLDEFYTNSGAVYVFQKIDGTWTYSERLRASDAQIYALFGAPLVIEGETALIAAHGQYDGQLGAVYVFERSEESWVETAKLTASDGHVGDRFGEGIDMDGDVAVFGAPRDEDAAEQAGSAYVFEKIDGVWTETQKLYASDFRRWQRFGDQVAVSDGTILVSAPGGNSGDGVGWVYVFREIDGVWIEVHKIDNVEGWMALEGNTAIFGASFDDNENGSDAGAAYVFDLNCGGPYLGVTGECPGLVEVSMCGNTAGDRVGIVYGFQSGSREVLPYCPGLYLDIRQPKIAATGRADVNGCLTVQGTVPNPACGRVMVQGVNVTTCQTTEVILIM